jgi:hypothetical protein
LLGRSAKFRDKGREKESIPHLRTLDMSGSYTLGIVVVGYDIKIWIPLILFSGKRLENQASHTEYAPITYD